LLQECQSKIIQKKIKKFVIVHDLRSKHLVRFNTQAMFVCGLEM